MGKLPAPISEAESCGRLVAERGLELVYGGAGVGLMGAAANAALEAGGRVIGIIPERLVEWEVAHQGLSELRVVGSMYERKQIMMDLSDAFIALPGGIGTLDEILEVMTQNALGYFWKPLALVNTHGFFDSFQTLLKDLEKTGFYQPRDYVIYSRNSAEAIRKLSELPIENP